MSNFQKYLCEFSQDENILIFKSALEDYMYDKTITLDRYPNLKKVFHEISDQISNLAERICLKNQTEEEISTSLGWLNPEARSEIYHFILSKKHPYREVYRREKLKKLNHLRDFDYNVKFSISSSHIEELNEPLLSLFLSVGRGTKTEETSEDLFHFEMNKKELKCFILLLREAHNSINSVKTS